MYVQSSGADIDKCLLCEIFSALVVGVLSKFWYLYDTVSNYQTLNIKVKKIILFYTFFFRLHPKCYVFFICTAQICSLTVLITEKTAYSENDQSIISGCSRRPSDTSHDSLLYRDNEVGFFAEFSYEWKESYAGLFTYITLLVENS